MIVINNNLHIRYLLCYFDILLEVGGVLLETVGTRRLG